MPENSKYKATKVSHSRHMKWLQNFFGQLWDTFKAALITFIAENFLRFSASLSYYTIAFNDIWGLKIIPNLSRKKYLIKRAISLGIFSLIGLLLFLSLMTNWLIEIFGNYLIGFFADASIYIVFAVDFA